MFPAVGANDVDVAKEAVVENDAVPFNEPVIPFDTVNVSNEAIEPEVMTFFQFGI